MRMKGWSAATAALVVACGLTRRAGVGRAAESSSR